MEFIRTDGAELGACYLMSNCLILACHVQSLQQHSVSEEIKVCEFASLCPSNQKVTLTKGRVQESDKLYWHKAYLCLKNFGL